MGQSTNGILAYGYDLGGSEKWKVAEWDPKEWDLKTDWYDADKVDEYGDPAGVIEQAARHMFAAAGEPLPSGYFDADHAPKATFGVEFTDYCSCEYQMWILSAHDIVVYRGDTEAIDFAALTEQAKAEDWDGKLRKAVELLGLTPNDPQPRWLLASMFC